MDGEPRPRQLGRPERALHSLKFLLGNDPRELQDTQLGVCTELCNWYTSLGIVLARRAGIVRCGEGMRGGFGGRSRDNWFGTNLRTTCALTSDVYFVL